MIERIFIPTVKRCDNQISFNNLPDTLKKRVTMVVRPSERHLYNYDCDYFTIPKSLDGSWTELAEVRKLIHKEAGNIKYAVIDDDVIIKRRNTKYFTDTGKATGSHMKSNMEKSKRNALPEDIIEMYDLASKWLDELDIGIVGLADSGTAPGKEIYIDTKPVYTYLFYDGKMISKIIDEIDITSRRVGEDVLFLLESLSRGINTRRSEEFMFENKSMVDKSMQDTRVVWTEQYGTEAKTKDIFDNWHEYYKDDRPKNFYQSGEHVATMNYIKQKFPHDIKLFIDEKTRKHKNIISWRKIYNKSKVSTLEKFL